jgi:hypothetical protein
VKHKAPSVRLYAILARRSPIAVIFRRGPSNQVLIIRWDTSNDKFEFGQWFKGRIYERRCDLSPDGDLLLYFAAKYKEPLRSWSAVSRPPYLTALAMWPKGDGWGGGGHFLSEHRIELNHRDAEMELAKGFSLPKWLRVCQFGERPGWGEDDPIWSKRLERDGWTLVSWPAKTKDDFGSRVSWEPDPAIKWVKVNPKWPKRYSLEMAITGIKERDGPWYLTEHSVVRQGKVIDRLGRSDWADWSHTGDLLFAMDGALYRMTCENGTLPALEDATVIADFSKLKFENREAPYGRSERHRK